MAWGGALPGRGSILLYAFGGVLCTHSASKAKEPLHELRCEEPQDKEEAPYTADMLSLALQGQPASEKGPNGLRGCWHLGFRSAVPRKDSGLGRSSLRGHLSPCLCVLQDGQQGACTMLPPSPASCARAPRGFGSALGCIAPQWPCKQRLPPGCPISRARKAEMHPWAPGGSQQRTH